MWYLKKNTTKFDCVTNSIFSSKQKIVDGFIELLIYFTVLWGPWAFGSVHKWSILTLNIANYGIGILFLYKKCVFCISAYNSSIGIKTQILNKYRFDYRNNKCTLVLGFLTIYMLTYILVSTLNAQAKFDGELKYFEYQSTFIEWLPASFDKAATNQSFLNMLGLACCFWGIRDWLLGTNSKGVSTVDIKKTQFNDRSPNLNISNRKKRLLWLLCISCGLLAFVGIIQRLDGARKLLWIKEYEFAGLTYNAVPIQSFASFGYRSNGISYLNMVLPIMIGLFIWGRKSSNTFHPKTKTGNHDHYFILLPIICLTCIASFVSLSRGGLAITMFLLLSQLLLNFRNIVKLNVKVLILLFTVITITTLTLIALGSDRLFDRFDIKSFWYETEYTKSNKNDTIYYTFELPNGPIEKDVQLFLITESRSSKYRKGSISAKLVHGPKIIIELKDELKMSAVQFEYANFKTHATNDVLMLTLNRSSHGLITKLNDTIISGEEMKIGNHPPSWAHPITFNEILLTRSASVNKNKKLVKGRTIKVAPTISTQTDQDRNLKPIEINLTQVFNLKTLVPYLNSRERIYQNSWKMAKDYWLFGCGLGGWANVYFLYHDPDEIWEAWAHCDWLEYWIGLGIMGFFPGFLILCLVLFSRCKNPKLSLPPSLQYGISLGILSCLLHAVIDFPLSVLSICHLFVILCSIKFSS